MPRDKGERWVDPAPLEIARPRLPWWLYLPWWVLALFSPVLAVVITVWLIVLILRRVYRYPMLKEWIKVQVTAAHLGERRSGLSVIYPC